MAEFDITKLFATKKGEDKRTPARAGSVLGKNLADVVTQMAPGYKEPKDYVQVDPSQVQALLGKDTGAGVADFGNQVLKGIQDYRDEPAPVETAADVRGYKGTGSGWGGMLSRRAGDKLAAQEERTGARKDAREDQYRRDMYGLIEGAMNRRQQLALARAKGSGDKGDQLYKIEELALKNKGYQDLARTLGQSKDPEERANIEKQMADIKNQIGKAYYGVTPFGYESTSDVGYEGQLSKEGERALKEAGANIKYKEDGLFGGIKRAAQRLVKGGKTGREVASLTRGGGSTVYGQRISPDQLASLPVRDRAAIMAQQTSDPEEKALYTAINRGADPQKAMARYQQKTGKRLAGL